MPKTSKSKATKVEKVQEQQVEVTQVSEAAFSVKKRAVIYDKLVIAEYSTESEHGALTAADMKELIGWETEKQFQERKVKEFPDTKKEHWLYGDDFHCLNINKEKVRCVHNAGNRPFDKRWCDHIKEMILLGQWAGPLTVPGETINGETIRISRYGEMLSGQHQGTALILACEELEAQQKKEATRAVQLGELTITNPKYPFWQDKSGPVIETIVVTGLSSDERILRTIDYVKPRTVADMLYTMPLFRENDMNERKEMTRMLAAAIDTLWHRTDTKGYMTHPEVVGFLERHNTLLDCVEHLFVENNGITKNERMSRLEGENDENYANRMEAVKKEGTRRISFRLKIQPGMAAAFMYLMATSATSEGISDDYRNMMPPSESVLDWSMWERARDFWTRLAGDIAFVPVRFAIGRLVDSSADDDNNPGLGGRIDERLAIICKAWNVFKDHPESSGPPFPFELVDGVIVCDDLEDGGELSLKYTKLGPPDSKGVCKPLPNGMMELLDNADFFGIDWKTKTKKSRDADSNNEPMPPPPNEQQLEEEAKKAREETVAKKNAKKGKNQKAQSEPSTLDKLAERAAANLGNTKKPIVRKP